MVKTKKVLAVVLAAALLMAFAVLPASAAVPAEIAAGDYFDYGETPDLSGDGANWKSYIEPYGVPDGVHIYALFGEMGANARDGLDAIEGYTKIDDVTKLQDGEFAVVGVDLFGTTYYFVAVKGDPVTVVTIPAEVPEEPEVVEPDTQPIEAPAQEPVSITYNGVSYIRLRDYAAVHDIYLGWDADTYSITVDTTKAYELSGVEFTPVDATLVSIETAKAYVSVDGGEPAILEGVEINGNNFYSLEVIEFALGLVEYPADGGEPAGEEPAEEPAEEPEAPAEEPVEEPAAPGVTIADLAAKYETYTYLSTDDGYVFASVVDPMTFATLDALPLEDLEADLQAAGFSRVDVTGTFDATFQISYDASSIGASDYGYISTIYGFYGIYVAK